jgi:hypothetical protein
VLKHSKLVFGLVAVFGVSLVISWLVSAWMGALTVAIINTPANENDLLMDVAVDKTYPLILSVRVTSNRTYGSLYLEEARISDFNETTVAEYRGVWVGGRDGHRLPICVLQNFGSEELLTLNFETSLPSGNYTLWFYTYAMILYPFAHTDFIIP